MSPPNPRPTHHEGATRRCTTYLNPPHPLTPPQWGSRAIWALDLLVSALGKVPSLTYLTNKRLAVLTMCLQNKANQALELRDGCIYQMSLELPKIAAYACQDVHLWSAL